MHEILNMSGLRIDNSFPVGNGPQESSTLNVSVYVWFTVVVNVGGFLGVISFGRFIAFRIWISVGCLEYVAEGAARLWLLKTISAAIEPLAFWKENVLQFPILSLTDGKKFCAYLELSPRRARLLATVGRITVTDMRLRMSANKVQESLSIAKTTARCDMGALKSFESPRKCPRLLFPKFVKGFLFRSILRMCIQNLKLVALSVREIIGGTQKTWAVPRYAHAPFSLKF